MAKIRYCVYVNVNAVLENTRDINETRECEYRQYAILHGKTTY